MSPVIGDPDDVVFGLSILATTLPPEPKQCSNPSVAMSSMPWTAMFLLPEMQITMHFRCLVV